MHFGRFPRKTILAATLFLAFSAANASFLEQTGTPSAAPVVMKTYGVDVATRAGLKAVIPTGWQLFVHRSIELPESLSWKFDESWVSVLNNFAKTNDIAILVDWDKKGVYFRSTAMAMQEQEKRQMIAQAAATPLPSFKTEEAAQVVAAVVPAAAVASSPTAFAVLPATAVATVQPMLIPAVTVAAVSAPAAAPLAPVGVAPVAVVAALPEVSAVVAAPPAVVAAEPRSAMDKLLSASSQPAASVQPVATFAAPKTVAPVFIASAPAAVFATKPMMSASPKPEVVSPKAAFSPAVTVVYAPVPAAAPTPVAVPVVAPSAYAEQSLEVARPAAESYNRQAVDQVIIRAAEMQGYSVSWEAADVQFPGPVTVVGADMGEDMKLVLRALGGRRSPVSIDVFRSSSIVRVRNATGAAEVAFMDVPFTGAIREKSASTFSVKLRQESVQAPTLIAAPAPVAVAVANFTPPAASITVEARAVVPEPERLSTGVAAIMKLEDASVAAARVDAAVSGSELEPRAQPRVAVAEVVLRVERGQALRGAIEALLEPGWTLKWDINGDMEANTPLEVAGESVAAVLNKVLPRMSLSADIYKPSKLVVVRPADAALDK